MSVFDTLAEQRYQDWLEKVSAPDYEPPPAEKQTARRQSFEAHVFGEVLKHLDRLPALEPEKRADCLKTARQLEMQLVILLEKRGMPHAIATLRASIAQRRQAVLERASRTPERASTKPAI